MLVQTSPTTIAPGRKKKRPGTATLHRRMGVAVLSVLLAGTASAQTSSGEEGGRFSMAAGVEVVGLRFREGMMSPAQLYIEGRFRQRLSPSMALRLSLSASERTRTGEPGPYQARTYSMGAGLEFGTRKRRWSPYGAAVIAAANLRVDDNVPFNGGVFNVGRDAATMVARVSIGLEFAFSAAVSSFVELGYQRYSNTVYGAGGLPLLVGIRF